mmetsp:Transcript_56811/g.158190  ORF Transcript_56811/g.158190 Transcript_56811/m.158190 type:complete len:224 (+) Transcript_56811:1251-1922(+)
MAGSLTSSVSCGMVGSTQSTDPPLIQACTHVPSGSSALTPRSPNRQRSSTATVVQPRLLKPVRSKASSSASDTASDGLGTGSIDWSVPAPLAECQSALTDCSRRASTRLPKHCTAASIAPAASSFGSLTALRTSSRNRAPSSCTAATTVAAASLLAHRASSSNLRATWSSLCVIASSWRVECRCATSLPWRRGRPERGPQHALTRSPRWGRRETTMRNIWVER